MSGGSGHLRSSSSTSATTGSATASSSTSSTRAQFRSQTGCCICGTKSSSSRFVVSSRYVEHFGGCFGPKAANRTGDLCNACVLCVKRWSQRDKRSGLFTHVLDSKKGPGPKHMKEITKRAKRREAREAQLRSEKTESEVKASNIDKRPIVPHVIGTRSSHGSSTGRFPSGSSVVGGGNADKTGCSVGDQSINTVVARQSADAMCRSTTSRISAATASRCPCFCRDRDGGKAVNSFAHHATGATFTRAAAAAIRKSESVAALPTTTRALSCSTPSRTVASGMSTNRSVATDGSNSATPSETSDYGSWGEFSSSSGISSKCSHCCFRSSSCCHPCSCSSRGHNTPPCSAFCYRSPNHCATTRQTNHHNANASCKFDREINYRGGCDCSCLIPPGQEIKAYGNQCCYSCCSSCICPQNMPSLSKRPHCDSAEFRSPHPPPASSTTATTNGKNATPNKSDNQLLPETTTNTRRYNRRVVLPPLRMTHNAEVDSLFCEIMERNSQAIRFDSREMHMAVQKELRLRNRTVRDGTSTSDSISGRASSVSSTDGSVETTGTMGGNLTINLHDRSQSPDEEERGERSCCMGKLACGAMLGKRSKIEEPHRCQHHHHCHHHHHVIYPPICSGHQPKQSVFQN